MKTLGFITLITDVQMNHADKIIQKLMLQHIKSEGVLFFTKSKAITDT